MADITAPVNYYTNLLIIQYHEKAKAKATIDLLARTALANGIFFDVQNGFDLETAVGKQLDIIGKYVGVDRFFNVTDPVDYFGLTDYTEVDPDSDQKYGFCDYATFDNDAHNGTINYNSVITIGNALNDDDYRVIIKLKIIQNNSIHSHEAIDDSMFKFFGNDVVPSSAGGMVMFYFVTANVTPIIRASLAKQLLPRPMGVGLYLIENVIGQFFGMARYNSPTPDVAGFQNYTNYGSVDGDFLTYNRIVGA